MGNKILTQELDYALQDNDLSIGLNAGSFMAEKLGVNGNDIKPCIAVHFINGCRSGFSSIGRNTAAHLIVVEMERLSIPESTAEKILFNWNTKNMPLLRGNELKKIIDRIYGRDKSYRYSCNHHNLSMTCIGKQNCPFFRGGVKATIEQRKGFEQQFKSKDWQWALSNQAKLIYLFAIPHWEYFKLQSYGRRLYLTYRQIAAVLGWRTPSHVKQYLQELERAGLIEFNTGSRWIREHKATEIKRILPIPDVPEHLRHKLK